VKNGIISVRNDGKKTHPTNLIHVTGNGQILVPWKRRRCYTQYVSVRVCKPDSACRLWFRFPLSDCLGAEKPGFTPSEEMLTQHFEKTMQESKGKVLMTRRKKVRLQTVWQPNLEIQSRKSFNWLLLFTRSFLRAFVSI
jgi:hypothetical protein